MTIVYLKDYKPSNFLIKQVYLEFKLDESATQVNAEIEFYANPNPNPNAEPNSGDLFLDGEELKLLSIAIDRNLLSEHQYQVLDNGLLIKNPPKHFTLYISNTINPTANTALSGLYFASALFCTQCEAQGFRRITYYLDRPDILAVFTVKIVAAKLCPVILSNGNLVDKGDVDAKNHYAVWYDPFKKPSYLFALVAGNLIGVEDNFQTQSGRLVTLKIYVEHQNLDQTSHAMLALKKAMLWDEQCYGREYDLDIYMIVAVNDFNMGAMENKGLNVFNSKYVLARPETATDDDFVGIDLVIGHEYFHNWSGNRVTCRDWFQLSLKEGFTVFREQQFTNYVTQSKIGRIDEVQVLRNSQFLEDAGPLAHSVQPDSYQQINNFYTSTIYNKGAELIGMQKTILGDKLYRQATDTYFSTFDGQAVTIDDFVATMSHCSGIDLQQFKLWYKQSGTPVVTVVQKFIAGKLHLIMCQHNPNAAEPKPFMIPLAMCLFDANGAQLHNEILMLTKFEQEFIFGPYANTPVVSINRGFSAPISLNFAQDINDKYLLIEYETDSYIQWNCLQEIYLSIIVDIMRAQTDLNNPQLLQVIKRLLLNSAIDNSLKAMFITMPTFNEVLAVAKQANPLQIVVAINKLKFYVASKLEAILEQVFSANNVSAKYAYEPLLVASRLLKGTALNLLMAVDSNKYMPYALALFDNADNMTDSFWALKCINNIDSQCRLEYLNKFYQRWADNKLIVNKWLSLQANAQLPNTLEVVTGLLAHGSFNLANPNNVYALILGFCENNPACFHAADLSGYKFLTQIVIKLNTLNPQVAARAIGAFVKFKQYDAKHSQAMIDQLRQIAAIENLSSDLEEIIHKSLANA
jgi:aminopeptidase N